MNMENEARTRYQHALALYEKFDDLAETEYIDDVPFRVFRGTISTAYNGLGISMSHYSAIMKGLTTTGSIVILQRGVRSVPTVLILHNPPTADEWPSDPERDLTGRAEYAILLQRVEDMKQALDRLDLDKLQEFLVEMAGRIERLEKSVFQSEKD